MEADYTRGAQQVLSATEFDDTPSTTTYVDDRLTAILSVDFALGIVREMLADDLALAEAAARSYTHSNGFDKITLLSSQVPEFKLRLHTWWATDRDGRNTEFIHSHRWFFRSTMLCGRLHLETFEERDGGVPMYRHEYQPRDEAKEMYELKVVGPSSLASDLMLTLTPGCTYAMGPDLLHRVVPASNAVSVTMVVRWAVTRPTAWVFAKSPILDEMILSVPSFTKNQLRTKLEKIVATLRKSS